MVVTPEDLFHGILVKIGEKCGFFKKINERTRIFKKIYKKNLDITNPNTFFHALKRHFCVVRSKKYRSGTF